MSSTMDQKIRFDCLDDPRLMAADVELCNGVLEITCTNPFDTIDLSYIHEDGVIDKVLVTVCDADGDVIKEREFDIDDIDWVVIDVPEGDEPVLNLPVIPIKSYGEADDDSPAGELEYGVTVRRRVSLN
ncbi:hypothetical protein CA54_27640 [Symmachiella macrocystis]|uniref:Uncharacterized protein n=2 Tax=Symmachiella macrocystis TaxID=2527985 RepID=A0A5C6BQF0_9PLAN|nr:hypothetical protein CA54_27640 [Symmachiella macrocystis]